MKATIKKLAAGTFLAILLTFGNLNAKGTDFKSASTGTTFEIIEEKEAILELEPWMTYSEIWNFNFGLIQENETGLELESWMTSQEVWDFNNIIIIDADPVLKISDWMINENIWNMN